MAPGLVLFLAVMGFFAWLLSHLFYSDGPDEQGK